MMHNTQDYRAFGLCPLSGILLSTFDSKLWTKSKHSIILRTLNGIWSSHFKYSIDDNIKMDLKEKGGGRCWLDESGSS
jgi:hypothetical protein